MYRSIENGDSGIPEVDGVVDEEKLRCVSCGRQGTVSLDCVHGILVCEECGTCYVNAAKKNTKENYGGYELVSSIQFDQYGRPEGIVRIHPNDSGTQAGVHSMHSARARKAAQYAQPYDASFPLKKLLVSYGNGLKLPNYIIEQATLYAAKLRDVLKKGSWKRELIVTSALYISIRMNRLPLTLLDITSQCMSSGINMYVVGRYYRAAVHLLGLDVPLMEPATLLPRLVEKVFALPSSLVYLSDSGKEDAEDEDTRKEINRKVLEDAAVFLRWLMKRELHAAHPHTIASVSIVMALEMNDIHLSIDTSSATALGTSTSVLIKKRRSVKQYLVSFGKQYLPFGDNIKMSNVMQYCRTIMRISELRSAKPPPHLEQPPILRVESSVVQLEKAEEHDDGCSDDDHLGLEDVDEYIRSEEEVKLFQQLQGLHDDQ